MSRLAELYKQLKKRRVIRAGVVYIAVFWLSLQVVAILVESGFVGEAVIRWLIMGGVILLPVVLILSWFYEHPWHERNSLSVVGDLALLTTVALVAGLLAWQQWSNTFSRPVIAVLPFQPTDIQPGTAALTHHLAQRFRMSLASLSEVRVIETESSSHPSLRALPMPDKAAALGADLLITGTINQTSLNVYVNVQLFDAEGQLLWTERFHDRVIDQIPLQNDIMKKLSEPLNLTEAGMLRVNEILQSCEYPVERELIISLAVASQKLAGPQPLSRGDLEKLIADLDQQTDELQNVGLFHLLRAQAQLDLLRIIEPFKRSVKQKSVQQDLEEARFLCPALPTVEKLSLLSTRKLEADDLDVAALIRRHPNDAAIFSQLAENATGRGDEAAADRYRQQACFLNPLSELTTCG